MPLRLPAQSGAGLASIIGSHPRVLAEWNDNKLFEDLPLAKLHEKYWGKSMADEEQEWRNTQTAVVTGGEEPQDGDVLMDEDGTDLDEDDIMPGCYNIDLNLFECERLWIRADYIRVYDYFEAYYNKTISTAGLSPAAVLTGQPGVGKSFWIYYALRRRFAERKPVIWLRGANCYLFVQDGVFKLPPNFQEYHFHSVVWTLADSDESKEGAPEHLVRRGSPLFVIYATSPRKERWSRLHKTMRTVRVIMNPWTKKEIFRAILSAQALPEHARISEIFDRLGPTARLCIGLSSEALSEYEDDINKAISSIQGDKLRELVDDAGSLTMDAVSHKLCLVSREKREDVHSKTVVTVITRDVASRLAAQFRNMEQKEKIRLYHYFSRVPESRTIAGIFFEAIVQRYLQDGRVLELIPMVMRDPSQKRKREISQDDQEDTAKPRWHSSHVSLQAHDPSLEASRQEALKKSLKIDIRPSQTVEFTDDGPSPVLPDVFYVPEATNHEALDSFILLNGHLYIFQFTVAMKHDIKPGLLGFLKGRQGVPSVEKWRFVFVIPPNLILKCPQPRRIELRLLAYSAVVSIPK